MPEVEKQFTMFASIANVQELVFRLLKACAGEQISCPASDADLAQDVSAALNQQLSREV